MRQVEKLVLAVIFVPNLFLCSVFFLAGALAVISKRNSSGSEGQQAASTALRGLAVSPLPPYLPGDLWAGAWVRRALHPCLSPCPQLELEGPTRSLGTFLACFARGLAVYCMTVSRQHVAPSASSQSPRYLPKFNAHQVLCLPSPFLFTSPHHHQF